LRENSDRLLQDDADIDLGVSLRADEQTGIDCLSPLGAGKQWRNPKDQSPALGRYRQPQ